MKTKFFITLLLMVILSSCSINKSKNTFILSIFKNLEMKKCYQGEVDGYLLRLGYFESKGSRNGINTFQTFSNLKDVITINTYDYSNQYYLGSNNPDVYNFILKNGTYKGTEVDSRGLTNLVYTYNNYEYWLYKEEPYFGGRIFYILSKCN